MSLPKLNVKGLDFHLSSSIHTCPQSILTKCRWCFEHKSNHALCCSKPCDPFPFQRKPKCFMRPTVPYLALPVLLSGLFSTTFLLVPYVCNHVSLLDLPPTHSILQAFTQDVPSFLAAFLKQGFTNPREGWFSRSGRGLENMHFQQVPKRCCVMYQIFSYASRTRRTENNTNTVLCSVKPQVKTGISKSLLNVSS